MTATQKNSSPPSYVEAVEQKRLNFACEQGVPCKKWRPIWRPEIGHSPRGRRNNDKESNWEIQYSRVACAVACIASICTEHTADARRHNDIHRKHVE